MASFETMRDLEISNLAKSIEEHATILRGQLEELAEIISKIDDDDWLAPDGESRIDNYDLENFANDVSVIEQMFFQE